MLKNKRIVRERCDRLAHIIVQENGGGYASRESAKAFAGHRAYWGKNVQKCPFHF